MPLDLVSECFVTKTEYVGAGWLGNTVTAGLVPSPRPAT